MSHTDFPTHSFDPGPLSWVMGEIREALGRSRTALFEAGGLEPEDQATALRLAKSHLQQAHGALQMADVAGVAAITQLAGDALDRFQDGTVKCTADHVAAITRLYGALVGYLEELPTELAAGAVPQPVRLFPYYAAVRQMLAAPRVHPADLFFPDLARTPQLPPAADADADYGALRQRFERALLPYLKSGDPALAQPLAEVIADVAAAQGAPRGHVFWLALQAFAELVAAGHVPGGVYVKQLFGAANLQMRRLAQGAPETPDAVLRDALFFLAAAEPGQLTPLATALREGFALDGTVPVDYTAERYDAVTIGTPAEALAAAESPASATREDDAAALSQRLKEALRDVAQGLDEFDADPAALPRLVALDGVLHQMEDALGNSGQPDAQAAVAHVRQQVAALAATAATDGLAPERIAQNVAALGFFADMLAHNADGARERFAFDAAQGTFRAVPLRKIAGPESIPILDEAVPAPVAPTGPASAAVPGASDAAIEPELLEIFVGEAQEMLAFIDGALARPPLDAAQADSLAALRRSFHTLKGSGRMVGLNQFADAAAAIERVLNTWLAEERPASGALSGLLKWTAAECNAWVGELVAKGISPRGAAPVLAVAERVLAGEPFVAPDDKAPPVAPPPAEPYVTDENVTDENVTDENVTDENVTDQDVTDETVADETIADEASPDENIDNESADNESADNESATGTVTPAGADDGMRFVGRLAVPAALFDSYVAQATALAQALARHFDAWRHQGELDAEALHLAHTLTGTSDTVGFKPLRELASALEGTLQVAPATLHDPAQHDLFDLVVGRARDMVDSFAAGDMPAEQPELIAVLERLREELARTHAAGSVVQARLDGMAAPDGEQDGKQEREQEGEPEGEEPPAADSLAARLDLLFTDTYHALLADPPPAPERGAPLPLRPQLASQDDSIDNLFDAAFEDAFAEPPLEQAAAPQLSLVSPAAGDSGSAQPADAAAPAPLVRVRADILGHLVHQAREVAATQACLESEVGALRGTLDDFEGNLGTLRQQLREVEMQAEAQIASRLSIAGEREFDPQEFDRYTQLQDLARGMAASVDAAAATHARLLQAVASASDGLVRQSRNTGDLQRDLLRVQDEAGTQ